MGEAKRSARQGAVRRRAVVTPLAIEQSLRVLGVRPSGVLLVHCSLSALGYVVHGVNGFVGESAREIREHCRALLEDEELARRMGAASREKAVREFAEERWRRQWREILTGWCAR